MGEEPAAIQPEQQVVMPRKTKRPRRTVAYRPMVYWPLHAYTRLKLQRLYNPVWLSETYLDQAWVRLLPSNDRDRKPSEGKS